MIVFLLLFSAAIYLIWLQHFVLGFALLWLLFINASKRPPTANA